MKVSSNGSSVQNQLSSFQFVVSNSEFRNLEIPCKTFYRPRPVASPLQNIRKHSKYTVIDTSNGTYIDDPFFCSSNISSKAFKIGFCL